MFSRLITKQKARLASVLFTRSHKGGLQPKCACGGTPGLTGECEECSKKRLSRQRKPGARYNLSVPNSVYEVLLSHGDPLDQGTRSTMELRFGHDFSQVRVHADSQAAESAQAVNAHAYAVGRNIVFGRGQDSTYPTPSKANGC